MLGERQRGFAVMDAELSGYTIESEDYETCLRYCRPGYVIIEQIPQRCGFKLSIERTIKYDKWLKYDKYCNRLDIGKIHIRWDRVYWHVHGKIVYRNEEKQD